MLAYMWEKEVKHCFFCVWELEINFWNQSRWSPNKWINERKLQCDTKHRCVTLSVESTTYSYLWQIRKQRQTKAGNRQSLTWWTNEVCVYFVNQSVLCACTFVFLGCPWYSLWPEESIECPRGYRLSAHVRGAGNLKWVFWKKRQCF